MAKIKKTKNDEIIEKALKDFKFSAEAMQRNRDNYADDIRFVFKSEQWPDSIKQERENDSRPCLTTNKLKKFVKNVAGEIRQNMPEVKFRPVDSEGDVVVAEVFNDIKRSINTAPEAQMADKIASECALAGGFGYYRLVTEYEDNGFNQVIKKKRIPNALTVYPDPSAQDYLYKDGKFYLVTEKITRDEFKRLYPKADPISFETARQDYERYQEWVWEDFVRLAEYYYMEFIDKTIVQMEDGSVFELREGLTKESIEEQIGLRVVNERKYKSHKIMWCKMTATEVIEGPIEIPSDIIPIIPVLGDEESLDGTRTFYSLIREAKDPQRMYNYWRTMAAELIALAPKAPFIGTPQQFENHEPIWDTANTKNHSRLTYNHIPGQPAPQRQRPPDLPAAAVNEANVATADIMDSMGRYQSNIGQQGNERSGRAILERKKEGDATSYSFIDNLHMSVIFEGEILAGMIPRVYDNERALMLMGGEDEERMWEINKVVIDPISLEPVIINDLTVGTYGIVPDAGPGYATKRAEIADSLMGILQFAPDTAPVIIPSLVKALDIPGVDEISQGIQQLYQPQPEEAPGGGGGAPGEQLALPMG